jgi:hypothetical protein
LDIEEIHKHHEASKERKEVSGTFATPEDVMKYFLSDDLHIKDRILLRSTDSYILTTVGRVVFNTLLPEKV